MVKSGVQLVDGASLHAYILPGHCAPGRPNINTEGKTGQGGPKANFEPSTYRCSGGGTRTHNLGLNRPLLCRLSYPGLCFGR
jgi:hypothetical protein